MNRPPLGKTFLISIALLLYMLCLPTEVSAQDPARSEELVYLVNAHLGGAYESSYYTEDLNTVYLVANAPSVVSLRRTLVYYWPITNEQKADLDALDEQIEGTLVVRKGGKVLTRSELTAYVIQYTEGKGESPGLLYVGEQAQTQWRKFDLARSAYRESVLRFFQDTLQYRQALDAAIAADELEGEPPSPPLEPEPFYYSSTVVNRGHTLDLPAGTYRMFVEGTNGEIVRGSQRKLIVFESSGKGVSYSVIPHDRYTFPEASDDAGEGIYMRGDSKAYLQPYSQLEFRDLYLTRLQNPQDWSGRADRYEWLRLDEIEDAVLVVYQGEREIRRIDRRPYVVRQITGAALGYEIHDQTTTDLERLRERRADFHGYELDATFLPPGSKIQLEDAAGIPYPGSQRTVRILGSGKLGWSIILPTLPFLAVVLVAGVRRRRFARLPREME